MKDYYLVLDVESDAALTEIKTAFRQKASLYHPDKNASHDAADKFREIKAAYDTLSVEEKRAAYDENRRRNLLDNLLQTAREIWTNYIQGVLH
ncbi:MAG: DnaJ domain-containing protein [Oxalobacteraceae bacterium]